MFKYLPTWEDIQARACRVEGDHLWRLAHDDHLHDDDGDDDDDDDSLHMMTTSWSDIITT